MNFDIMVPQILLMHRHQTLKILILYILVYFSDYLNDQDFYKCFGEGPAD